MSLEPQPKEKHSIPSTAIPLQPKAPRRSSRKRMCSRYLDEDMVTLEDSSLWSPALSKALQERYGDSGRKRTPRTLTRLMQQHRENERHRHHGLNASIRAISKRIPGFDEENKETKIVKLQRIINYICHLEQHIKTECDDIGFTLDYKNLFLSPHITKNPDEWKPGPKSPPPHYQPLPKKYTSLCLKQHLEDNGPEEFATDQNKQGEESPMQHLLSPCAPHFSPGASCSHSPPCEPRNCNNALRNKGSGRAAHRRRHQKGTAIIPRKDVPTRGKRGHTDILPYTTACRHEGQKEDLEWLDFMESATADVSDTCQLPFHLPDLDNPQQLDAPGHHILSPAPCQGTPGHHRVNLETCHHGKEKHIIHRQCLPHRPVCYMMNSSSLQQCPGHYFLPQHSLQHNGRLYLMSPRQGFVSSESLQHDSYHLMGQESLRHASNRHVMDPESLEYKYMVGPESMQNGPTQHPRQEQLDKVDLTGQNKRVYHPVPCCTSPPPSQEDEANNANQSLVDVSTFHSYARINDEVNGKLLNEWEMEVDEECSVKPQGLTDQDLLDPHNTDLTSQHDQTVLNMPVLVNEGDLSKEMTKTSQQLELVPADLPTLAPNDFKAEEADERNTQTCNKEGGVEHTHVDLRKTSWMNGFMMFSRLHRKQYIDDNPGVHTSHISRLMGIDWRKLTFREQQPYREKAKIYIENYLMPQLVTNFNKNKKTKKQ